MSDEGSKRYWLVTCNNPGEDWKGRMESLGAQWGIGQLEAGENQTPHIQCLLWFRNRVPNKYWVGKGCWSKSIASADVKRTMEYCTKAETRLEGPHSFGKAPNHAKSQGGSGSSRKDWDSALDLSKKGRVKEVAANVLIPYIGNLQRICHLFKESTGSTDGPRGLWIVGAPGTGKSYYARQQYPTAFIKSQNKWWDGYYGQDSVILDDLDKLGSCLGHLLKIWLDEYPCDGEVKGGTTPLNYKVFVITSNYWPSALWDDPIVCQAIERRCKFTHFTAHRTFVVGTDFGRPNAEPSMELSVKDIYDPFVEYLKSIKDFE